MTKPWLLQRELPKIIQNLLVIKSRTSLIPKCVKPKPIKPKTATPNFGGEGQQIPPSGRAPFWKKMSIFIAFPAIVLVAGSTFLGTRSQHEKQRPPFVKYDYMRIRNKRFPWGDGKKTFFHNPHVNALPDGYED